MKDAKSSANNVILVTFGHIIDHRQYGASWEERERECVCVCVMSGIKLTTLAHIECVKYHVFAHFKFLLLLIAS